METKIIKIHYPKKTAEQIGGETALIRDKVLEFFENNQVSFSFSSNKESGYIMIYPTAPIASIRVSNHETSGQAPVDNLIIETKRGVTINAEMPLGDTVATAIIDSLLREMRKCSTEVKTIIQQNKL